MSPANRTRRFLLQGLAVALGGGQAGAIAALGRWSRAIVPWLAVPAAAESASPGLSPADRDDLVAFTGVLVAGTALSATDRQHIMEYLQGHERAGAGYPLDVYRTTARVLARLGGARFATLDLSARLALVRRHDLGRAAERPADSDETRVIRARAVPDLIGAYYGSAPGWAVVGYDAFPGRCGTLERYTRPEA